MMRYHTFYDLPLPLPLPLPPPKHYSRMLTHNLMHAHPLPHPV